MARVDKGERETLKHWRNQIVPADKVYERWETEYRCKTLHDYYLGKQWQYTNDSDFKDQLYTINLFFPSIEMRRPSLVFQRPRVRLMARPNREDDPGSTISARVRLLEDTANAMLSDRRTAFIHQAHLALQDSFFRFGILEVNYSADPVENPNADMPILNRDGIELKDENGEPLREPKKVIREESFYFKRIPACQFRASISSNNLLSRNDWVGYFEWVHLADIKSNPKYAHRSDIKPIGRVRADYDVPDTERYYSDEDIERYRGMCKIWKVWDLREMRRYIISGDFHYVLFEEDFEFLPFTILKFHEILDEFYPLPPAFNWLSPQDELNETRDAQKVHRRRFYRRYMRDPSVTQDEWEKVERGGDGVCIEVPQPEGKVVPIPNAEMDRSAYASLPASKEDFMQVAGITGEQRGVSEADTATQANIIDINSRIRETFQRTQVADWIADAVTIMLKTMVRRMALPMWIRVNVDPTSPGAIMETQNVAYTWQLINSTDLPSDFNWEVSVDIETMSPATEDRQRVQFIQAIQMLQSPMALLLLRSDVLLRKFLHLFGIRNEKEISEVKKAVGEAMMIQQMMAMGGGPGGGPPGGPKGPNGAGQVPEPQAPPDLNGLIGQLAMQPGMR